MNPDLLITIVVTVQSIIFIIVCVSIYYSAKLRINIVDFSNIVDKYDSSIEYDDDIFTNRLLGIIRNNDLAGKSVDYNELSDFIYLNLTPHDSTIKSLINFEIIIGLIGTFFGLLLSLNHINPTGITDALTAKDFMQSITDQIEPFLQGFTFAFSTSIAGIGFSLLAGFIFMFFQHFRTKNINELLYVVSKNLLPKTASDDPETKIYQAVEHFSNKVEKVTDQIDKSIHAFQSNIQAILQKTNDIFRENMDVVLEENKTALKKQNEIMTSTASYVSELKLELIEEIQKVFDNSKQNLDALNLLEERIKTDWSKTSEFFDEVYKKEDLLQEKLELINKKEAEISDQFKSILTLIHTANESLNQNINTIRKEAVATNESLSNTIADTMERLSQNFEKTSSDSLAGFNEKIEIIDKRYFESIEKIDNLLSTTSDMIADYNESVNSSFERINQKTDSFISEILVRHEEKLTESNQQISETFAGIKIPLETVVNNLNGLVNDSAERLRGYNEIVTSKITDLNEEISATIEILLEKYEESFTKQSDISNNSFENINSNIKDLFAKLAEVQKELEKSATDSIERTGKTVISFEEKISSLLEGFSKNVSSMEALNNELPGLINIVTENSGKIDASVNKFSQYIDTSNKSIKENIDSYFTLLKTSSEKIENSLGSMDSVVEELSRVKGIENKITSDFNDDMKIIQQTIKDFANTSAEIRRILDSFETRVNEFELKVLDNIEGLFKKIENQEDINVNISHSAPPARPLTNVQRFADEIKDQHDTSNSTSHADETKKRVDEDSHEEAANNNNEKEEFIHSDRESTSEKTQESEPSFWGKIKSYF